MKLAAAAMHDAIHGGPFPEMTGADRRMVIEEMEKLADVLDEWDAKPIPPGLRPPMKVVFDQPSVRAAAKIEAEKTGETTQQYLDRIHGHRKAAPEPPDPLSLNRSRH